MDSDNDKPTSKLSVHKKASKPVSSNADKDDDDENSVIKRKLIIKIQRNII
jgi:hypothetical protein